MFEHNAPSHVRFPIEYDLENQIIRIGKLEITEYTRYHSMRDFAGCVLGDNGYTADYIRDSHYNQELSKLLGIPLGRYYKTFKGIQHDVFIKPHKDVISKFCFGYGGKPSPRLVNSFYNNKEEVYNLLAQQKRYLVPFLLYGMKKEEYLGIPEMPLYKAKEITRFCSKNLYCDIKDLSKLSGRSLRAINQLWGDYKILHITKFIEWYLRSIRGLKYTDYIIYRFYNRLYDVETYFEDPLNPILEEMVMFELEFGGVLREIKDRVNDLRLMKKQSGG